MTEFFLLEPVAVDEQVSRLPDDLPVQAPERDKLENALRESGYAIVSIEAVATAPVSPNELTDATRLRAAVAAVVNEADDSEDARLEAAATAESADDLDERFWGPGPDSATAVKAVLADLSEQFVQRRQLAENGISRDDTAALLGITAQSVTAKLAVTEACRHQSGPRVATSHLAVRP